jgi:hypothetical protein
MNQTAVKQTRKNGKFVDCPGPGRPRGSLNKFTRIKQDMAAVWEEENGKEHFRRLFRGGKFTLALKLLVSIMPKNVRHDLEDENDKSIPLVVYLPEVKESD